MAEKSKSSEIKITRVYDAPVEVVWEAWSDERQVAKWWGPRGFTLTSHSKDLRPGGIWHYTMHGPDGTDYENKTLYHEVEKHSRLVYDHGGNDERRPLFRMTVLFSELKGNKTKLELHMKVATAEEAGRIREAIKKANGESTWDRLAEYLAKNSSDREIFVITRAFDAPAEVVFDMWTKAEHLSKWLPPTGFTMTFLRGEIRPGDSAFYVMSNGKDATMYGRVNHQVIDRSGKIVYTQQFCDENENISRHPMAPVWPETMLTTVVLTSESPSCTRVRVEWESYGKVTAEELEAFVKMRASMTVGWTGSLEKLQFQLESSAVTVQSAGIARR